MQLVAQRRPLVLVSLALLVLTGCGGQADVRSPERVQTRPRETQGVRGGLADSAWPCPGHDNADTHRSQFLGPIRPVIKRAYALADSPVLGRDGTLYVSSKPGLVALGRDGRRKWEYRSRPSHGSIWSPTVAKDGTIYSITSSGTIIALRPNGTKKWGLGMRPRAFDLLIGPEGTIYCADTTGCVFAIRPNGRRRLIFTARHGAEWKEAVGTGVGWAALAMAPDGVLYLAVSGPRLYAISPNGKRLWSLGPSRFPVYPALEEQRSDNDKRWLAGRPGPDVDLKIGRAHV